MYYSVIMVVKYGIEVFVKKNSNFLLIQIPTGPLVFGLVFGLVRFYCI